jgi:hypothetical protein
VVLQVQLVLKEVLDQLVLKEIVDLKELPGLKVIVGQDFLDHKELLDLVVVLLELQDRKGILDLLEAQYFQ